MEDKLLECKLDETQIQLELLDVQLALDSCELSEQQGLLLDDETELEQELFDKSLQELHELLELEDMQLSLEL